jgi:formate/nitrite transporter FocA (FNT family)
VMLPVLRRRRLHVLLSVARLWSVVLIANLAGALAVAWVLAGTGTFGPEVKEAFSAVAMHGGGAPFGLVLLRGVFAGWLIALMVWLMPAAESGRVAVIILITYVIGLGGFAHVIAGSVDKLYLVISGQLSLGGYLGGFLVPSLLGNIIGGVSLVAALNHGAAGRDNG